MHKLNSWNAEIHKECFFRAWSMENPRKLVCDFIATLWNSRAFSNVDWSSGKSIITTLQRCRIHEKLVLPASSMNKWQKIFENRSAPLIFKLPCIFREIHGSKWQFENVGVQLQNCRLIFSDILASFHRSSPENSFFMYFSVSGVEFMHLPENSGSSGI